VAKKYIVTLTKQEREELMHMLSVGKSAARKLTHARVLLKADAGSHGPAFTVTTGFTPQRNGQMRLESRPLPPPAHASEVACKRNLSVDVAKVFWQSTSVVVLQRSQ